MPCVGFLNFFEIATVYQSKKLIGWKIYTFDGIPVRLFPTTPTSFLDIYYGWVGVRNRKYLIYESFPLQIILSQPACHKKVQLKAL